MTKVLLPSNPFAQARGMHWSGKRRSKCSGLDPNVPIDTNHLEREIRAIALGRTELVVLWTEVGARHVGYHSSLLASCRLQGVDPYVYLVDVLQRVDTHPLLTSISSHPGYGSCTSRRIPCARISIACRQ